ncbi:MAG: hypothetical protein M1834_001785 [Cirrosporium novae-zelandiae]|nr:MAG: hypothetical protein M1834_001785 [Cirrosporium novae-zelandiae]
MGTKRSFDHLAMTNSPQSSKHSKISYQNKSKPTTVGVNNDFSSLTSQLSQLRQNVQTLLTASNIEPLLRNTAASTLTTISSVEKMLQTMTNEKRGPNSIIPPNMTPQAVVPRSNISVFKRDTPLIPNVHQLPLLPPVSSDKLLNASFTHSGMLHSNRHVSEAYERLEFLGDAYIEVIASRLIFEKYPNLNEGKLSQLREMLVKNETLAEWALAYGFDKRAIIPPGILDCNGKKSYNKVWGDIMEAYVAAIILDDDENGFRTAETWLLKLFTLKLEEVNPQGNVNKSSKEALQRLLVSKGVRITYKDIPTHSREAEYFQGVYLNGWGYEDEFLGHGGGKSKQEAQQAAAAYALSNNTVFVSKVNAIKKKFDEKTREKRQQA